MAATATTLGTLLVGSAASGATAATAGLFGVGGAVTTMGVLSGAATAIGVGSSIAGGFAQRNEAKQAAQDETLNAKAARLKGEQEQNRIRKSLLRDVSAATARAGAAGFGGALLNQQTSALETDAGQEIGTSAFNTGMEARRRKAQSAIYRKAGRTSILDIAGPVAEGAGRLATAASYR